MTSVEEALSGRGHAFAAPVSVVGG